MYNESPERKIIAPSETFLAPSLAICADGSPFAVPFIILKSFISTYMPSLLPSCPITFCELELQLSVKPLIRGEFCHCAIAKVEPITIPSAAPTPTNNKVGLDADIVILRIPEVLDFRGMTTCSSTLEPNRGREEMNPWIPQSA